MLNTRPGTYTQPLAMAAHNPRMSMRARTLQHDLGVGEEGGGEPGVVRAQERQRGRLVPEHVLPVGVVAQAGLAPLPLEPRPHRLCRLHRPG